MSCLIETHMWPLWINNHVFWCCKVFKYNTSLEKHKIFISGLSYACTQQQLEELSKPHGTIKAIRLVTNRSGKPKVWRS